MVYMNGDNLEKFVNTPILKSWPYRSTTWTSTSWRLPTESRSRNGRRLDERRSSLTSPRECGRLGYALADWGERNMGYPQTLIDLSTGKEKLPRHCYVFIFWDHAWGWRPDHVGRTKRQDARDPHEIITAMQAAGPWM